MQVDKQMVLDLIEKYGDSSKKGQAQQELPDKVDTDQHADLLQKFGVSPETVIKELSGGGLGNLL